MLALGLSSLSQLLCADEDPECRSMAAVEGNCRRNWAEMVQRCPQSCGLCVGYCADELDTCAAKAAAGRCAANPRGMLARCPESCGACPQLAPPARRCDTCLALQEAVWRGLVASGAARRAVGELSEAEAEAQRAVEFACASHEFLQLRAAPPYHRECELALSRYGGTMVDAWAAVVADGPAALEQQESARTVAAHVCGGNQDEACAAGELRGLHFGAAVGASPCSVCRAMVSDVVLALRRTGAQARADQQPAAHASALELLDTVCDELELRHPLEVGAAGSRVYSECVTFVSEHRPQLEKLSYQWSYAEPLHFVCSRRLGVCPWEMRDAEPPPPRAAADWAGRPAFAAFDAEAELRRARVAVDGFGGDLLSDREL